VLGIESATEMAGAALADDSGLLDSVSVAGRRHGESLAPAVEFVCARAGVSLSQLDAVCVDVGPGLFTGLRVGVSTAKALGFALGVPVVAVGSLELLAGSAVPWMAAADPAALLVPVIDARRGLLFAARFGLAAPAEAGSRRAGDDGPFGPQLERQSEDRLTEPEALAEELAAEVRTGRHCVVFGDGARRFGELLRTSGARVLGACSAPDVGLLATTGVRRALAGEGRPASELSARYLRPADVRINWETRMTTRPPRPTQLSGS